METWLVLFVINRVLASLCPFTTKIGSVISSLAFVATLAFIVLTFFFAPHWWYGLIVLSVFLVVPLLLPRIDPEGMSENARIMSGIGSTVNNIIVVLMYLALFKWI
jgi:hypothetical protein